jgi:formylglycine-generating enzyme required for sulfatase activity/predicted Ser/Thr protein kinase
MLFSFHCPACKGKLEADASSSGSQADCPQCGIPVAIPEPRVAPGTTLAGLRLERRLGKGGMGEVYLARQLSVERQVAVKILPPGFAENPDAVRRFLKEGKLAARLDHFNIVTVFEAGEDSGNYYLAMAYIEGESLDQRLKRDKVLPEAEALTIVRTIADALAYAWGEFQLLHRDLKPANIMVDRRGRVFLMDLGLAKSLGEESGMTISGSIIGTPQYMSPEQAQGLADLGVPTDVYALGATLYHLVTGTPPFTGETTLTVLHKHMYEPLPPPRWRNANVTDACSHLIETMMAKKPEERYGDWRTLIADIDRVLQGEAPAAHRPGAGASVVMPARPADGAHLAGASAVSPAISKASMARQAQQALARQHQAQAPKAAAAPASPASAKRRPGLTIGIVAAAVVVLAVTGGIVASRREPAPAPASQIATAKPPTPTTTPTAAQATTPAEPESAPTASAPPTPGQPWTVPDLRLELVWVEPGSFQMGSNDGEPREKPVHAVRLSRGFWLGKYEVTQAEYEAVAGKNPSNFRGARNPVEMVSWDDAVAFCAKLTERERKARRLPEGYEYRLPTEAEWEYGARGGAGSKGYTYPGSNNLDEVAWCFGNSGDTRLDDSQWDASSLSSNNDRTHPVGQKKPNELGLYDLSGNVWEWCLDGFDESYYATSPGTDPVNLQAGAHRVFRGGCWSCIAANCRAANRINYLPSSTFNSFGFRVSLAPAIPPALPAAVEPRKPVPTPAESAAPAPAPAPTPTATPDPAQARLSALLEQVASDLAAGKPADALRRWQAGCAAPELKPVAEQVAAIGRTLSEAASIPQHLLESFKADTGKTVEIELLKEKVTCDVREVTTAGIKVNQIIKQGQGTAKLGRTIALGELSMPERLRRLGAGDTPELNLQRGLLALEAGRPDNARRLFETAGGPLGEALVARIEAQRAEATEAAAERALSELLRQISGSPKYGDPVTVIAGVRRRCGDDPRRREGARKLLAEFEKEWGRKEPGKTWVPVVQEAMVFPFLGDGWTVPDLGLELVWVAPGSFEMGSNEGADSERPVHTVRISRGYWIGKYEVTQAEYEAVVGKNPSQFKRARNPVETVSWSDAVAFCTKLFEREQKVGRLPQGYEYRLPTDAEWEYAARGGAGSKGFTYSGSNTIDEVAWIDGNSGGTTHPVGQRRANGLGLYDMSGNVCEWCWDWYDAKYYGRSPNVDPANTQAGSERLYRGGSWPYDAGGCRVVNRLGNAPSNASRNIGFRLVLAPSPATTK